jgi:hypothetical protein
MYVGSSHEDISVPVVVKDEGMERLAGGQRKGLASRGLPVQVQVLSISSIIIIYMLLDYQLDDSQQRQAADDRVGTRCKVASQARFAH